MQGKESFDLLCREYQQQWKKQEDWWGLLQLWKDWKGHRHLLPHLLSWHPLPLPSWITNENEMDI